MSVIALFGAFGAASGHTIAAVLGHASLTTTTIHATAIGAEARELVSRVWS